MSRRSEKALNSLIEKLPVFRELETTPERHVHLLYLITRCVTLLGGERPILVGGGAVEFYSGSRFITGDLDLIAPDTQICEEALYTLGFEHPESSGHFINRTIGGLVEIHSTTLRKNEEPIELVYRKIPLLLISPEDCITSRLVKYKKHGSTQDLLNAFMVSYHQNERIDAGRLVERIGSSDLWDYYRPIQDICRELVCNHIGVDEAAASLIHFIKTGKRECAF